MTPLMPKKIIDYGTLKQSVLSIADRSDEEFTAAINNFILMAESQIYTDLRTPANEVITEHEGASQGKEMLVPDGLLEVRDVYRNNLPIDRLTADELFLSLAGRSAKTGYARVGNKMLFAPELDITPNSHDTVKMIYWVDWSLRWSDDKDTNPLLIGNPDIYLWGALVEAFLWLDNGERASFYEVKFQKKMDDIKKQVRNDDQSGGDLKVKGRYL